MNFVIENSKQYFVGNQGRKPPPPRCTSTPNHLIYVYVCICVGHIVTRVWQHQLHESIKHILQPHNKTSYARTYSNRYILFHYKCVCVCSVRTSPNKIIMILMARQHANKIISWLIFVFFSSSRQWNFNPIKWWLLLSLHNFFYCHEKYQKDAECSSLK